MVEYWGFSIIQYSNIPTFQVRYLEHLCELYKSKHSQDIQYCFGQEHENLLDYKIRFLTRLK